MILNMMMILLIAVAVLALVVYLGKENDWW